VSSRSAPQSANHSREFDLDPQDNARLANLCGPLDEHLRLVESRLGVEIRRRGNVFRLRGARARSTESVLRDLYSLTSEADVTPEQVHLRLAEADAEDKQRDARAGNGSAQTARDPRFDTGDAHSGSDHSGRGSAGAGAAGGASGASGAAGPDAFVFDAANVRTPRGPIKARGPHQRDYLAHIRKSDLSFGIGPAGTGKTYLAVACAVEALNSERVRRLVLVRPAVEAGERLGFLPGDLSQKVDPYLRPIYDALYEMLGFERVARLMERNVIEVAPLAFMRGRSLNESFIILDEAQNTTTDQMKMFLTRIGFGSRAVVTGDVTQTDLPAGRLSGLRHAIHVLRNVEGIAFTFFDTGDIVRHPLVQRIVQAYEANSEGE
jgi:phosphate starvation-inducible PhoH-like protein